jgi:hypothetical protein
VTNYAALGLVEMSLFIKAEKKIISSQLIKLENILVYMSRKRPIILDGLRRTSCHVTGVHGSVVNFDTLFALMDTNIPANCILNFL